MAVVTPGSSPRKGTLEPPEETDPVVPTLVSGSLGSHGGADAKDVVLASQGSGEAKEVALGSLGSHSEAEEVALGSHGSGEAKELALGSHSGAEAEEVTSGSQGGREVEEVVSGSLGSHGGGEAQEVTSGSQSGSEAKEVMSESLRAHGSGKAEEVDSGSHGGSEAEEVFSGSHGGAEAEEVVSGSHGGAEAEEVAAVAAWPGGRRGAEEDVTAAGWRGRPKHVFVLSEAGKPIYSRHGNEEALAATMGVMMALVSFIQSGGNAIRAICSEDRTLVFEQRGPLLLVSVSRTRQSPSQLRRELAFVHEQILSLLTRGGIARVFARRRGYDLRRLLAGAEAVLDRLLAGAAADGRLLLGAARCLPLPSTLRRALSSALRRAAASSSSSSSSSAGPAPALALLAAGGRLVTAARQRALAEGGRLCASDLHLLLNLLASGAVAGEVWTPVCLPHFNPDGYFYAYAATLGDDDDDNGGAAVTLILLSTEREGFYAAAACRRRLEEALRAGGWLRELAAALRAGAGYGPARPGAPELRHFLYKPLEGPEEMQQLPQFTSPELEAPYSSEEEQQRLFDLYHHLHGRVHSARRPLRLLYHVAERETLLAWVTTKFELYGCFSPLVTKAGAIGVLTKLLRWLKKEEDWLFIRYPPPYCAAPARPEGAEPEG